MPNKSYLAIAALVGVVTYDLIYESKLRQKLSSIVTYTQVLHEQNAILNEQISYMVEVINKYEVELDEFDLIMLPNITQKSD